MYLLLISITHFPKDLMSYNTRRLVRLCDGRYDKTEFTKVGIKVEDLVFSDGGFPHSDIIEHWITIVRKHFAEYPRGALAVHCRSGLGRSPVLVAVALMEAGMKPQEAVDLIRS